jgi:phosphohistidine phosphatase
MKKLFLCRHAKSYWGFTELNDIDRPLKPSGVSDALMVAEHLRSKGIIPDAIITSPAIRAVSTALIYSRVMETSPQQIIFLEELYKFPLSHIAGSIIKLDESFNIVFVFGHEPTLSSYYQYLTGRNFVKFPTSAIAGIKLEIDSWKSAGQGSGEGFFYTSPKQLGLRAFK